MTKYLLQSGGLANEPEKAAVYFEELFANTPQPVKLLWCFFASKPEDYEEHLAHYQKTFKPSFPSGLLLEERLTSPETFADDVAWADVVYIHGGNFVLIEAILKNFDLPELFKDKVVGLNSASGMTLSVASWSCDTYDLKDGLGILPVKFIPHYNAVGVPNGSELTPDIWMKAKTDLEAYGDVPLPIHALEEGEFVVFEV